MGQIVHGNKSFGYAPIINNGGVYSFGTPVMMPGLVSATVEVSQEDTKVYADDITYAVIKGAKVRSAELHFRKITAAYAQFLGFKQNANGSLTDTGSFPNHCIFFETEDIDSDANTQTTTLHILYCAKGSTPTQESQTDEETTEAGEFTVNYTCTDSNVAVDDDGNAVQYLKVTRTSANALVYDTFDQAVILPTTAMSV